ncbi:MAG: hypothetical protein FJ224_08550 [Lentisphaerae bacterium]|nr:hypothetical protein [Lentisphaerota bacterium]
MLTRTGADRHLTVHASVLAQKRMDRFTLRGRLKVNIQPPSPSGFGAPRWMLYCMVHNMEKIVNFGESYALAGA